MQTRTPVEVDDLVSHVYANPNELAVDATGEEEEKDKRKRRRRAGAFFGCCFTLLATGLLAGLLGGAALAWWYGRGASAGSRQVATFNLSLPILDVASNLGIALRCDLSAKLGAAFPASQVSVVGIGSQTGAQQGVSQADAMNDNTTSCNGKSLALGTGEYQAGSGRALQGGGGGSSTPSARELRTAAGGV